MPAAILGSGSVGLVLVIFYLLFQLVLYKTRSRDGVETIPLEDGLQSSRIDVPYWQKVLDFGASSWKLVLLFLLAIALRIHAFVFVSNFPQCGYPGVEVNQCINYSISANFPRRLCLLLW